MPNVYPFNAIQHARGRGDASSLVAPPYDVLDAQSKRALLERDPRNIVAIDLPHTPAKEPGPPEAYAEAAHLFHARLADGVLTRRERPAIFAYRQTFDFAGKTHKRAGMACAVEALPFGPRDGGGILPHEQTFSGPKEDRLALMKATAAQLSPIFGIHADEGGAATRLLASVTASRPPDQTARTDDGVLHEVWAIDDDPTIRAYADALAGEDVFIADGHHRYNTALNYLRSLEEQAPVPDDHPARRVMIVLVGMSDPGLVIGPTHRVLGGMALYSIERFIEEAAGLLDVRPINNDPARIEAEMAKVAAEGHDNVLGLIDFDTGLCYAAVTAVRDPLEDQFPDKPPAWRTLDVAIVQHLIVEQICEPALNDGNPVKWAFPHTVAEALDIGRGAETGAGGGAGFAQIAVIVRPTPLHAVREVSKAGELMPQKSTFFVPKLATGLFINPLT